MKQFEFSAILGPMVLSWLFSAQIVQSRPQNPQEAFDVARDQINDMKDIVMDKMQVPELPMSPPSMPMDGKRRRRRQTNDQQSTEDYDYNESIIPLMSEDSQEKELLEELAESFRNMWKALAESMTQFVEACRRIYSETNDADYENNTIAYIEHNNAKYRYQQ